MVQEASQQLTFTTTGKTVRFDLLRRQGLPRLTLALWPGFMMQFAADGQWGRGLYFAEEASYSHFYATKADANSNDLEADESEFMLAGLRIGDGKTAAPFASS